MKQVRSYKERPTQCQADPSCPGSVVSKEFCSKHYTRFRKYGDPNVVNQGGTSVDPKERFESKYLVDEASGCWLWTGAANGHGWATISINGKATMAHRYAYETFRGPIPEGSSVSRICGKGACVNPEHLVLNSNDPIQRFWANVDKQDDHWLWKLSGFTYQSTTPRKYAWALVHGESDELLYSLCGESKCVRPEHAGNAEDRFWSRVDKNADGCWYWMGSTLSSGYPHLTFGGVSVYAHRLTYEWAGGVLEEGCVLSHTCGHLSCVKPAHLEQISYGEMVGLREENRKPEACLDCGKTYRNLKAHVKVHTT